MWNIPPNIVQRIILMNSNQDGAGGASFKSLQGYSGLKVLNLLISGGSVTSRLHIGPGWFRGLLPLKPVAINAKFEVRCPGSPSSSSETSSHPASISSSSLASTPTPSHPAQFSNQTNAPDPECLSSTDPWKTQQCQGSKTNRSRQKYEAGFWRLESYQFWWESTS